MLAIWLLLVLVDSVGAQYYRCICPAPAGGLTPGLQPGILPGIGTGILPGTPPGIIPGLRPGVLPGVQPGYPTGIQPGILPGLQPGVHPGLHPGLLPGVQPMPHGYPQPLQPGLRPQGPCPLPTPCHSSPCAATGMTAGMTPGISSGFPPGTASGFPPGISSGIAPGIGSGFGSGIAPGIGSGFGSGIASGIVPGISSGFAPGVAPGIAAKITPGMPDIHNGFGLPSSMYPGIHPGRGLGYVLPHIYYLSDNDRLVLMKHLKTIGMTGDKAHVSPFDTDGITSVKAQEILSHGDSSGFHAPFPEPSPLSVSSGLSSGIMPGYIVRPTNHLVPLPEPGHGTSGIQFPGLNDCCIRCTSACHYRSRRNLRPNNDTTKQSSYATTDVTCTDDKLKDIMLKGIESSEAASKREIQKLAEEAFGGDFHVICSRGDFSYITRSSTFCQASKEGVSCYAFRTVTSSSLPEENQKVV